MKKSQLKNTHEVLSEGLKNESSDFMFGQYNLQAISFIKSKIYKPFVRQTGEKKLQKTCVLSFLIKI